MSRLSGGPPDDAARCLARVIMGQQARYARLLQTPPSDQCLNRRKLGFLCVTHNRLANRGGIVPLVTPVANMEVRNV